jgi:pimeloyl-ACP methyl ester carboxylesterase
MAVSEPSMQEFSHDNVQIAFIDEAAQGTDRNEPIILIHGFASTHAVNWVLPLWVKTLTEAGRRVIAFDNRGHGRSSKLYDPQAYTIATMAGDALALLDHLKIAKADVMGYSLGARIAALLAKTHPERVRSLIIGGLGYHLIDGAGLPSNLVDAMEARSVDDLSEPIPKMFRAFAEATKSDLKALAACLRGSRQVLSEAEVAAISVPTLVAVGTQDDIAGEPHRLAALFPNGQAVDIPGRDHNKAVGDKVYKNSVLNFLSARP